MAGEIAVIKLSPIEATPETFKEFGQVIQPASDRDKFGPGDAQLELSRGSPRLYIMHLERTPVQFRAITHHANVTQCLGAIGGHDWYLGVAAPSLVEEEQEGTPSSYVPPAVDAVRLFKVSGSKFLKLHRGTWHAGPLFLDSSMDFYNLELTDTNAVDQITHDFAKKNNAMFAMDA